MPLTNHGQLKEAMKQLMVILKDFAGYFIKRKGDQDKCVRLHSKYFDVK